MVIDSHSLLAKIYNEFRFGVERTNNQQWRYLSKHQQQQKHEKCKNTTVSYSHPYTHNILFFLLSKNYSVFPCRIDDDYAQRTSAQYHMAYKLQCFENDGRRENKEKKKKRQKRREKPLPTQSNDYYDLLLPVSLVRLTHFLFVIPQM